MSSWRGHAGAAECAAWPPPGAAAQQEVDMGLFDAVAGAIGGGGGGGQADLVQVVMKLVQQSGGLEGLIAKFQQGGLGEIAQSWISTGPNLPISPDQLGQALGPETLSQLGAGGKDMLGPLSQLLPQLVDGLTPNGQLPAGGGADLAGMLGGLLGGAGGAGAGGPNLGGLLEGFLGKR
jgi:uncharacterized protein YidB (DUF937 family)